MERLLGFIFKYRNLLIFLFFELVSFYILINFNKTQQESYHEIIATINGHYQSWVNSWNYYFQLDKLNRKLTIENIELRKKLIRSQNLAKKLEFLAFDTSKKSGISFIRDTRNEYDMIPCKVVYNTLHSNYNHIIINKGKEDGIKPESGLISKNGVVGIITHVNQSYSLGITLLNQNLKINSIILPSKINTWYSWHGTSLEEGKLAYVPLHHKISIGDTVVTSEYSSMFPENVLVGTISNIKPSQSKGFYVINVKLATEFQNLDYLYVLQHKNKAQIDSLINLTQNE